MIRTTAAVTVPPDPDHYRDVSQAQTALDGAPLADPFYVGEYVWYNPAIPWLIAAGSAVTDSPPLRFHARAGGWLDLIAPLGFYAMTGYLFGPVAALPGTVAYVFFTCGDQPVWMCGTYSPWMFASQPAQGFFFFSVLVLTTAHRRDDTRWYAGAGLLAGLTFLAHTAPAAILASLLAAQGYRRWKDAGARRALRQLAAFSVCSLLVASPFLAIVLGYYRARIVNPVPMIWEVGELTPDGFPAMLAALTPIVTIPAAVGLLVLLRQKSIEGTLAKTWIVVSFAFVLYGVARHFPLAKAWGLPVPFPTFHWWIYLTGAVSLLFGIGCAAVVRSLRPRSAVWQIVLVAVLALLVVREWPRYERRGAFTSLRHQAENTNPEFVRVSRFVRQVSSRDDVFLATHGAGILIVGPAGRRTVAMQPHFSNPYVDHQTRARDRDEMFRQLKNGDVAGFLRLADKYRVTHVIANSVADCREIAAGAGTTLEPLHQFPQFCVYRLTNTRTRDTSRLH